MSDSDLPIRRFEWRDMATYRRAENDPGFWLVTFINNSEVRIKGDMLTLHGCLWFRRFDGDVLLGTIAYPLSAVHSFEPTDTTWTPLVQDWEAF